MIPGLSADKKAEQLEADFGVRHPRKALKAGLAARLERDVTPFQRAVALRRIDALADLGYTDHEACIILLMRGARLETLNVAMGGISEFRRCYWVSDATVFAHALTATLRVSHPADWWDRLVAESQRNINFWRRS